jgi:hypothetical protein
MLLTWLLLMLLLLSACSSLVDGKQEMVHNREGAVSYTLHTRSTNDMNQFAIWNKRLKINVISIDGLVDNELQNTVNSIFLSSSTEWVSGKVIGDIEVTPEVLYQSEDYICVLNLYTYEENLSTSIYDYILVDISEGKRVFLNDLVKVDMEFVIFLKNKQVVRSTSNKEQFDGNVENLQNWISAMSDEELFERLVECSMTQTQIANGSYEDLSESIGSLIFRNNFYINEGLLVLFFGGYDKNVTISLDDIEEFLLVPKW